MSTTRSWSVRVETRGAQEMTARRASSSGSMISSDRPVSRRTSRRNWAPLRARRHASVATSRMCVTSWRWSFWRHTRRAPTVRAMAARESRPVASRPWPSWTDFENESTTWNCAPLGWAISMRHEFVPRSSAA